MKFANLDIFDSVIDSRADIRETGSDGKTRTPRGNGWTHDTLRKLQRKRKQQPVIPFYEGLATFRAGTLQPEGQTFRQVFPQRYFINSWFELPPTFSEVV